MDVGLQKQGRYKLTVTLKQIKSDRQSLRQLVSFFPFLYVKLLLIARVHVNDLRPLPNVSTTGHSVRGTCGDSTGALPRVVNTAASWHNCCIWSHRYYDNHFILCLRLGGAGDKVRLLRTETISSCLAPVAGLVDIVTDFGINMLIKDT